MRDGANLTGIGLTGGAFTTVGISDNLYCGVCWFSLNLNLNKYPIDDNE